MGADAGCVAEKGYGSACGVAGDAVLRGHFHLCGKAVARSQVASLDLAENIVGYPLASLRWADPGSAWRADIGGFGADGVDKALFAEKRHRLPYGCP
nr:hypothetical protein [Sinosporangium siamense]